VGQYQCSGADLQRCKADQTGWDTMTTCATPALCDWIGKTCALPLCAPNEYKCVGAQLQVCNAGRDKFDNVTACTSAALCDAVNGRCNVCVPNSYTCAGADLHKCASDGQSNPTVDTCASSAACNAGAGRCNTCPSTGRGPTMVNLGSICIDSTEVTVRQYNAFLAANPPLSLYPTDPDCSWETTFVYSNPGASNPPPGPLDLDKPAWHLTWCKAYAFCAWSGKRLCGKIGGGPSPLASWADATQNQWYYACTSAGTATPYPYGSTYANATCWTNAGGNAKVQNVQTKAGCHGPSAPYSSIFDMSGNADEWEDSCESSAWDSKCRTRGGSARDPQGYVECSANWSDYTRNNFGAVIGFRCCAP
jgi:hypothetical protein